MISKIYAWASINTFELLPNLKISNFSFRIFNKILSTAV
jgi:hypothetical protein